MLRPWMECPFQPHFEFKHLQDIKFQAGGENCALFDEGKELILLILVAKDLPNCFLKDVLNVVSISNFDAVGNFDQVQLGFL